MPLKVSFRLFQLQPREPAAPRRQNRAGAVLTVLVKVYVVLDQENHLVFPDSGATLDFRETATQKLALRAVNILGKLYLALY